MTLQRCHHCKIYRENFTKILNKSVYHGRAAKKVLILRTSKTPILSFWGYISFIKNKLREEKHKKSVVTSLWKTMALQVINTRGRKFHQSSLNLRPAILLLGVIQVSCSYRLEKERCFDKNKYLDMHRDFYANDCDTIVIIL